MAGITKEEQKRRAELLAKGLKVCSQCKRELPVEQFTKAKRAKDGLQSKCKECRQQYNKSEKGRQSHNKYKQSEKGQQQQQQYNQEHKEERQQYYQEHKEELKQYNQQYYQNNKEKLQQYYQQYNEEHKEQRQQYHQQYYQDNKEQRQQYYQQYRQEHKEQNQQHFKQYYQNNKMLYINHRHKRLEWEKQGNGFTPAQWEECLQFFNYECAYSGKPLDGQDVEVEHIVARANGGVHEIWNICPAIKEYNRNKRAKNMEEWYSQQDYFSEERLNKIYEWQQYAYNKWGKQDKEFAL